jgi:hypothetical protein
VISDIGIFLFSTFTNKCVINKTKIQFNLFQFPSCHMVHWVYNKNDTKIVHLLSAVQIIFEKMRDMQADMHAYAYVYMYSYTFKRHM